MKKTLSTLLVMLSVCGLAYADYEPPSSAEYPPQTLGAEPPVHDNPETLQTKPGDLGNGGSMDNQGNTNQDQNTDTGSASIQPTN